MKSANQLRARRIEQRNASVQTRQVSRRRAVVNAMREINKTAGGEPRARRRAMARSMGKRQWKESQAGKVAA